MSRYVTRSQWGARPPTSITVMPKPVDVLYVHHDAGSFMSTPVPTIQTIQRTHMDVNGWRDIAYQEWIAYTGDVYEGRGFGVTDGATAGESGKSLSICLQGNFVNVIPTRAQIDSLVNRIVAAAQEGRLAPGFRILAHQQAPPYIRNGKNLNATACCGTHLLAELPAIRQRVAAALAPAPSPTDPEDDMYYLYTLHPDALNSGEPADWLVTPGGDKFACPSTGLINALKARSRLVTIDLRHDRDASAVFRNAHP